MDPNPSAQDLHRCDLCETAIVHSYCDFCHVNLCKLCVVDHISDGYDKHKLVPFKERRSTLTYPKCGTHPQKSSEFQCKSCNNILICSSCITSEQHRGHIFLEISEEYKTMKKVIEKETEELENRISPKYEEIAHDLINQLTNLDGEYEELTTEICKQGEQLHQQIDIIINKMKTEISEIKINHRYILQKQLDKIEQIQSAIKQTLLNMNEILKSTEVSPIIEYSSKVREFNKLPLKLKASKPAFIPKPINQEVLYDLFGQIIPLSTNTEENVLKLSLPKPSVGELLDEPELVATIETGHEKLHKIITCLNGEKLLTSGESGDIKCYNNQGLLINAIKTHSWYIPTDIAVDVYGDILYTTDSSRIFVTTVKTAQIKGPIFFELGSQPINMCVTSTGDLLVFKYITFLYMTNQCQLGRYSGSNLKQKIQFDDDGKPLFSRTRDMKYITENRNHDICVADSGAYSVVVLNQDGKLRWRYTGYTGIPSINKIKSFKPFGITTDSQSRILTADSDNHCIHILDQSGKFLRYIDNCDLKNPYSLCVGTGHILFVSECNQSHVKKIRYLR
ncbi:tripartite motif-containing protein 3-like [Magallana gigas]|uniref:tripartite motif-containing protein 3-like n=1 Tax=Magallana gigas TaxID=29159 RepID=UPI00333F6182